MTDIPNCSNCSNEQCPINKTHKDEGGFVLVQDSPTTVIRREQVRLYGCLSHPQAREYLMREVIEELERLRDTEYDPDYTNDNGCLINKGELDVYDHAIALVRNGVKK